MLVASLNQPVPLEILAVDGRTDLYAQVRVYTAAGALYATLAAPHVAEGLYTVAWTPTIEGYYTMVAQLYTDALFTVDAGYEKQGEQIDVNTVKSAIVRILGLHHENAVVDLQSYDGSGNLTSCRVRLYDSKPNALSAGLTGLLHQYSVTASYSVGLLSNYTMVRDT